MSRNYIPVVRVNAYKNKKMEFFTYSIFVVKTAMRIQKTSRHKYFEHIPDHRINRNLKHSLCDIIILSIWVVLCGAESWDSIETFGKTKYAFLKNLSWFT